MACIRDRVVRDVVSLADTASCAETARLMVERGIGSVGVREGTRLVGLVTERDLVRVMANGDDPSRTLLFQVLRKDAPSVSPQATEVECAQLMKAHRTRHLAVKDGDEMVGVISLLDLGDMVVGEKQSSIEQLEAYIRGGRARQLSEPITTVFSHGPAAR